MWNHVRALLGVTILFACLLGWSIGGCSSPVSVEFRSPPCQFHVDCPSGYSCIFGVCTRNDVVLPKEPAKDGGVEVVILPEKKVDTLPVDLPPACKTGTTRSCYDGLPGTKNVGACRAGTQECVNGQWDTGCLNPVLPLPEECDNSVDDDCDGQIDENCGDCSPGMTKQCQVETRGECKPGTQTCGANRKWGSCKGAVLPSVEICDNKDNDCDGQIDNVANLGSDCDTGFKGPCKPGKLTCDKGVGFCKPNVKPVTPEACDGKDDDCDGVVDNGCQCKSGEQQACYNGPTDTNNTGECKDGVQFCQNGQWGPCMNATLPAAETCNNKDDDCNGLIDDNPSDVNTDCPVANQKGECAKGKTLCVGGKPECKQLYMAASQETCGNGLDDDCDGEVDEIAECPAATSAQCLPCNQVSVCPTGYECLKYPSALIQRHCHKRCSTNADCPSSFACDSIGSGKKACLPPKSGTSGGTRLSQWYCEHYTRRGQHCNLHIDCGALTGSGDRGAVCASNVCYLQCTKSSECPGNSASCSKTRIGFTGVKPQDVEVCN